MSRGLGRVERRIIDILTTSSPGLLSGSQITWWIAEPGSRPTPAIVASVRRALARLKAKNIVLQLDRRWVLSATHRHDRQRKDREEADRRARQRRRAETDRRTYQAKATPTIIDRTKLAKLLGMLGSDYSGEVVAAARAIERERKRTGKTWQDLLDVDDPKLLRELLRRYGRRR